MFSCFCLTEQKYLGLMTMSQKNWKYCNSVKRTFLVNRNSWVRGEFSLASGEHIKASPPNQLSTLAQVSNLAKELLMSNTSLPGLDVSFQEICLIRCWVKVRLRSHRTLEDCSLPSSQRNRLRQTDDGGGRGGGARHKSWRENILVSMFDFINFLLYYDIASLWSPVVNIMRMMWLPSVHPSLAIFPYCTLWSVHFLNIRHNWSELEIVHSC